MRVSWLLPLDHLPPNFVLFVDCVAGFHIMAFIVMVFLFLSDIFKGKKETEEQKQQTIKDREKFMGKLEDLKRKEDEFMEIGRVLTKHGKDKNGNRERLEKNKKID